MEVDELNSSIGVDDNFAIDFGSSDSIIEYNEDNIISEDNDFEGFNNNIEMNDNKLDDSGEIMEEERLEMDEDDVISVSPPKRPATTVQMIRPKTQTSTNPTFIRNIGVQNQQVLHNKGPVKIAAKPNSATTSKANGGQILIIQSPNGTQQTIRLSGENAQSLSAGGYQLVKTPDGSFIQIRKKSNSAIPSTSSASIKKVITQPQKTSTATPVGKLIYKGINVKGNEQHVMLSTAPTKVPATIVTSQNGTITTQSKTLSVNDVQQLRLINPMKQQIVVSQKNKESITQNVPKFPNSSAPRVVTNTIKKITMVQPKVPVANTAVKAAPVLKKVIFDLNNILFILYPNYFSFKLI